MDNDRALADMLAELAASLERADRGVEGDGLDSGSLPRGRADAVAAYEAPALRAA